MALFKAVVWALIFLTKLRFPPGVSIAIVLKGLNYPDNSGETDKYIPLQARQKKAHRSSSCSS